MPCGIQQTEELTNDLGVAPRVLQLINHMDNGKPQPFTATMQKYGAIGLLLLLIPLSAIVCLIEWSCVCWKQQLYEILQKQPGMSCA